jgi:hypothetical protein
MLRMEGAFGQGAATSPVLTGKNEVRSVFPLLDRSKWQKSPAQTPSFSSTPTETPFFARDQELPADE